MTDAFAYTRIGAIAAAVVVIAAAAVPAGAAKRTTRTRCTTAHSKVLHARRRCHATIRVHPDHAGVANTPLPRAVAATSVPTPTTPTPTVTTTAAVPTPAPVEAAPPLPSGEPFRFYSPSSFWNTEVPAGAQLDPNSGPIMAAFDSLIESELQAKTGPSINTTEYSVPIYTVPAEQPTVKVTLDAPNAPALQEAWNAVPMPPNARPAAGSDGRLVVWQPSTDKLWEFWRADLEADGWHAAWGGATQDVSTASGLPDPQSWPGAKPWWGGSACSLGVVGGLITLEDLETGVINHALQISIPNVRATVFAAPALRTDGTTESPLVLPEGAHLRLDPDLDLESLHLPRVTLMIARAAQRYGIFVTNGGSDVAFQAQDPTPTGTEPYRGPDGFWEGSWPRALLSSFPWERLQLLKMELHG